jgi:hypothetical protein
MCFQRTWLLSLFVFLASVLLTEITQASFSLPPRFSANGYASDYTVGEADLMLPLKGDNAHNFYLEPDLAYGSNNQGYGDLGIGYRWVYKQSAILGAYLFGSYSRIENNTRLWTVNPGLEILGSRWDMHCNGYWVTGNQKHIITNSLGSSFFIGHAQFVDFFQEVQHTGNGLDAQLAYQLFPQSPLQAYVGSYFFSPSGTSAILGGATGLEYWLDQDFKVFAHYTYDNLRHSTGAFGLGIELGGTHIHRSDPTLEERMTDPIARYLSELGRGSAIPNRNTVQFADAQLLLNNIAFFSQTGRPNQDGTKLSLADCTFAAPCGPNDFTQMGINTLNSLLPNTTMYFNGGSYSAVYGTDAMTLHAGQSIHSRTADYSQPAQGMERSLFNGALNLNSNNTLANIILLPIAPNSIGIVAINATSLSITGSQIGSDSNPFFIGIFLLGTSQGYIRNSAIFANGILSVGTGNSANLTVQNSAITMQGNGSAIQTTSSSLLTLQNSTINVHGNGSGAMTVGSSRLSSQNSSFNVNGNNATGLLSMDNSAINLINSRVNVSGSGQLNGLRAESNSGTINTNTTQITVSSSNQARVLSTTNNGLIQINNGVLIATGDGTSVIADGNNIQINTSTCSLNDSVGCP